MSFIYEPQLVQQLINIVQPRVKQAQAPTPTTVDPAAVKTLAGKMLDNLNKASSIVATRPDTALYMTNLQSLDQLLKFLKINNIQYNGKWIVSENYDKLDPADKKLYVPYQENAAMVGADAGVMSQKTGIYREGLIAYLKSLQQKANASGGVQGQFLTTRIGQLIEEANNVLKLKIDPTAVQETSAKVQPTGTTSETPTETKSPNQQVSYHPTGATETAQLSPAGQQAAMVLISNGPFTGDRIDLPRMNKWLESYASVALQVHAEPSTISNIQKAQQILNTIMTTYHLSRFPFAQNASGIISTIMTTTPGDRSRKVNAPNALLNQLKDAVNTVGDILTDFRSDIYEELPDARWQNALDEQIGSGASSFYNISIDKITEWLMDLPNALQSLKSQGF